MNTDKDLLNFKPGIQVIRNQRVVLSTDLAYLYEVLPKVLVQAVKRNLIRFPSDFMFQLSEEEWANLKSQIVTSSWGGRRKLPFVFSEHGVLMLSSVLSSQQAIQVNIQIVRIFSRLRKLISEHNEYKLEMVDIKKKLTNHDKNIETIFSYIDELTERKAQPRRRLGYMPDDL